MTSPPVPGAVVCSVTGSFCTFQADQSSTGVDRDGLASREAEQPRVVHLRRVDDLAGVEQVAGIEALLDGAEGVVDLRAELPADPFAAAQAVAMLAAVGALTTRAPAPRPLRRWRASSARRRGACRGWAARAACPPRACAYQVPRVPWRNTSVSASVYSARCSSGTAQSSMKLTGLPSPFRLIMMLRPALRTSHSAFCAPRRASRPRCRAGPGRPSDRPARSCAQQHGGRRRRTPPAGWRPVRRSAPSAITVGGTPGWRAPARSSCGRPAPPRSAPA